MEGKGFIIKDVDGAMTGNITFKRPKSYSIIVMNIETVEDVEKVIEQCEGIKKQIASVVDNKALLDTGIELAEKSINIPQK